MSKKRDDQKRAQKKRRKELKRQKARKAAAAHLQDFGGVLPPDIEFVGAIPGMPKMSEQLLTLIEPYIPTAQTPEAYHKLLQVGMIAWNIALLPPGERDAALAPFLKEFGGKGSQGAQDFLEIVGALMQRKASERRLARDNRLIMDFTITHTPTGPSLQVLSALTPP